MKLKGAELTTVKLKTREDIRAALQKDNLLMCETVKGSLLNLKGDPGNDAEMEAVLAIWLEEIDARLNELNNK